MHGVLYRKPLVDVAKLGVPGVEDTDGDGGEGANLGGSLGGEEGQAVAEAEEGDGLTTDPECKEGGGGGVEVILVWGGEGEKRDGC